MFHTASEALEAHIDAIDEEGLDGLRFAVRGHLKSETFRGARFTGVYDAETRTGRLRLQQEAVSELPAQAYSCAGAAYLPSSSLTSSHFGPKNALICSTVVPSNQSHVVVERGSRPHGALRPAPSPECPTS